MLGPLHPRALRRHGRELQGLHVHLGRARALLPDHGADVQHAQPDRALDGHPGRRPRHAARRARAPRAHPQRALPLDPRGRRDHEPAALGGHRARRDRRRRDDRHARAGRLRRSTGARSSPRSRAPRTPTTSPAASPARRACASSRCTPTTPACEIVGDWDTLGMRGTDSRTLVFKDAFVAADDELLPTGLFDQLAARWPHVYLTLTPTYIGLTRAVVDFVQGYLGSTPAAGRPGAARRRPPSSGPGRRSRSPTSAAARSGSAPSPRPGSTRRPSSCGAPGPRRTRPWRRRPRWPRSRSAPAAAAR